MSAGWIGLWLLLGLQGVAPEETVGRLWAQGKTQKAQRLMDGFLSKAPARRRALRRWQRKRHALYYLAGRMALKQKQPAKAIAHFKIASRYATFYRAYVLYHLGRAYGRAGKPKLATRTFLRLLRLHRSYRWKRRARPHLIDNYAKAREWRALLRLLPVMLRYSRHYGPISRLRLAHCRALTGAGRVRKAKGCWRDIAMRYPRSKREKLALAELKKLGDSQLVWSPAEKIARYYRLRWRYPDEIKARSQKWMSSLSSTRKDEKWLRIELQLLLSRIYLTRTKYKKAAMTLKDVLKQTRQAFYVRRVLLPLSKAIVEGGGYRDAVRYLHRFVEEFPDDEKAPLRAYRTAWLALKAEQFEKARRLFAEFRQVYPRHKRAHMARWFEAWTYFRRGWYRKALREMGRWGRRKRYLSYGLKVRYWSARIYERQGKLNKAVKTYRALIARAPFHLYAIWARLRLQTLEFAIKRWVADSQVCLLYPGKQRRWDDWPRKARRALPRAWLSAVTLRKTPRHWTLVVKEPVGLLKTSELLPASLRTPSKISLTARFPSLPAFCRNWRKCGSLRRAQLFAKLGLHGDASYALYRGRRQLGSTSRILNAVRWLRSVKAYNESVRLMIRLKNSGRSLPLSLSDKMRLLYPTVFTSLITPNSRRHKVPTMFSLAIMREESRFLTRVASKVGARGLMQIYPPTGRKIARRLKMKNYKTAQLYTPTMNVFMGTWYLGELLKKFEGHVYHAAGGYNAGPHRVARWLKKGHHLPSDAFVEEIPFRETRRYVKRVYHSYVIYSILYRARSPHPPTAARVKVGNNINF